MTTSCLCIFKDVKFVSLSYNHKHGGVAELVEGARLEIVYAGRLVSRVRIPAPPPACNCIPASVNQLGLFYFQLSTIPSLNPKLNPLSLGTPSVIFRWVWFFR